MKKTTIYTTVHGSQIRGFSTLELLVAFAVMTLSIVAVILLVFGNQSVAVDTELAQRALYQAEQNLEVALAEGVTDIDGITTFNNSLTAPFVSEEIEVTPISACAKRITSTVSWGRDNRSLSTTLVSKVVDPAESAANDHQCPASSSGDDWDNPQAFLGVQINGPSDATAVHFFEDRLYLTNDSNDDFFVYDFDGSVNPPTLTELGSLSSGGGFYDVTVIDSPRFAFLGGDLPGTELYVVDVSNPSTLNPGDIKHAVPLLNGVMQPINALFYYDGFLYVGVSQNAGEELHIFDVSGVSSLIPPTPVQAVEIGADVNDIVVRGDYVYLATADNNAELKILDLTDLSADDLGFDADSSDDAMEVHVDGEYVYLGRKQNNPQADDFYILSISDVLSDTSMTDGNLGSHLLISNNSEVVGLETLGVAAGQLIFVVVDNPTDGVQIYFTSDPANLTSPSTCAEAYNFSENTSAATVGRDSLGVDYLFVANKSNNDIRVIRDDATACTP